MLVDRPNTPPPSAAELQSLEQLRVIIQRITSDGILTEDELQIVQHTIYTTGKVTPQKLELVQHLIWDKLNNDELEMSWR